MEVLLTGTLWESQHNQQRFEKLFLKFESQFSQFLSLGKLHNFFKPQFLKCKMGIIITVHVS